MQPRITPWKEGCGQTRDPAPRLKAPPLAIVSFQARPLQRTYSLVNVYIHCVVVHGEDLGVVMEAAVGTDVELRAQGQWQGDEKCTLGLRSSNCQSLTRS